MVTVLQFMTQLAFLQIIISLKKCKISHLPRLVDVLGNEKCHEAEFKKSFFTKIHVYMVSSNFPQSIAILTSQPCVHFGHC